MAYHNSLLRLTIATIVIWHVSCRFDGSAELAQPQNKQQHHQVGKLIEDEQLSEENLAASCQLHAGSDKNSSMAAAELMARLAVDQENSMASLPLVSKDRLNRDIYTRSHMGASEKYFYHLEGLHGKHTIAEVGWMALTAKLQCSVYSDMYSHRYDNFNELKVSGGPLVDQELCLKQLRNLNERALVQSREGFSSKDINLYQLLDTYGRVPPGLLIGHASWIGIYNECNRMKIEFPAGPSPTRYCWAHIRHKSWPENELMSEVATLKSGVCLPKACDSMNYKDKYDLVMKLIEYHMRDVDTNQGNITSLYCLPDEESPLRIWWQNPRSFLTVTALASWCLFLVFCTVKSDKAAREEEKQEAANASPAEEATEPAEEKRAHRRNSTRLAIYRSLSITNNLGLLFNTTKKSALLEVGNKLKQQFSEQDTEQVSKRNKIVDLSCIEGIKVICMSYVIMGHVLMCVTTTIINGRETAASTSPTFFIANLVPAFAVNSFFTITAILTSYLMFKQNQSHSFITSPLKWTAFITYRYLRIMPMYLIVVLYTKHVARYVGSGPQWDYGTSSLGQRRACENESWLWTLLFGANLKSPLDHCIPSAWYLANDFQFFIVTPIFLALLNKSAELGSGVIKLCMVAGFVSCFMSVYLAEVEDLTPVARFMPHGFKTYVTHLYSNYTRPQYRIPAYLCGLLIGFVLHQFEQDKFKYLAAKREEAQKLKQQEENGSSCLPDERLLEPGWSENFKNRGVYYSIFFVALCCLTPVIGSRLPFNKHAARFMVALIMPSYHILFSLSVGLYILLATTGYGNKHINSLLSASLLKPLARLSLCAVLINVEVINYIIQSNSIFQYLDNQYQFSLNMLCIISTYLVSIVVCVLFEAPMRAALNHLLSFAMKRAASKQKAD